MKTKKQLNKKLVFKYQGHDVFIAFENDMPPAIKPLDTAGNQGIYCVEDFKYLSDDGKQYDTYDVCEGNDADILVEAVINSENSQGLVDAIVSKEYAFEDLLRQEFTGTTRFHAWTSSLTRFIESYIVNEHLNDSEITASEYKRLSDIWKEYVVDAFATSIYRSEKSLIEDDLPIDLRKRAYSGFRRRAEAIAKNYASSWDDDFTIPTIDSILSDQGINVKE
jgi:hypothetical protein